jgi:Tfp pilus assembly protein PilO
MKARDRMVAIVVALAVVLGGVWTEVVSPERQKASKLTGQIASARSQLASAETSLQSARGAQSRYAAAYTSVVNLGKAVPPSPEVPSLIYQIAQVSNQKKVNFASISTVAGGSSSSSSSSAAAPSASAASSSSFAALPFTLTVSGGFFEIERLFRKLDDLTTLSGPGDISVAGRLLTVQSVKLAPADGSGLENTSELTGSITASAYVLPASQSLTGGAASPSGSSATPASASSSSSSSVTTPAIVKASP